jgi:DNA-binding response OmpR family regulator
MMLDIVPTATLSTTSKTTEYDVLILDDNDGNRMLLKFAMSLSNLSYVEVENGSMYRTAWAANKFTFAFLDIELPDMNGIEIAAEIRLQDPNVAIIMCSTNDDPNTVSKAVKAGADLFLVKPFQLDALLTLVKVMTPENLRTASQVLVVDNTGRVRWEPRTV